MLSFFEFCVRSVTRMLLGVETPKGREGFSKRPMCVSSKQGGGCFFRPGREGLEFHVRVIDYTWNKRTRTLSSSYPGWNVH